MGRAILPSSRVQVVPGTRPRPGRVWAYCDRDGRVLVHRCLGRRRAQFVFQGDTNPLPDPPVAGEMLVGLVAAIEHAGRVTPLGRRDRWLRGWPRVARFRVRRVRWAIEARLAKVGSKKDRKKS
ncbi:MAG: S24/S26 family peptidase [Acidimicrobiales bacterium]